MGNVVVIDIGKTVSKASLWSPEGRLIERLTHPNTPVEGPGFRALDAAAIDTWLAMALRQLFQAGQVSDVIPIAHGAAFALVRDGELALPVMDYEQPIPAEVRKAYDRVRDPFEATGSPALPNGLNAGAQLYWLQSLAPAAFQGNAQLLPWAQYWAWRLCGVAASEVTSLGCHTDLWNPHLSSPSGLARRMGWDRLMAPLRRAGEVLGTLDPRWATVAGTSMSAAVHCGLHDSNAALLAARSFHQIGERESTVLSTGTWFVAMRTPAKPVPAATLESGRDCLLNVDACACTIPSARFMGGREIELLTAGDSRRIDAPESQPALLAAMPALLAGPSRLLPGFSPGNGPFPHARGRWDSRPANEAERAAAVCLYAALMSDVALDLVGSVERVLVEGRFAAVDLFVRALAALRPGQEVYRAHLDTDVSYGALRLINSSLVPEMELQRVEPLPHHLDGPRRAWRSAAAALEAAA